MAPLVAACVGAVQPSSAIATPRPSPAIPTVPAVSVPARSPQTSSDPDPSDAAYLAGLDADAFVDRAESRGLTCETYASEDPTSDTVWSCSGHLADGSELLMYAQGPDPMHLVYATAEVLGNGPVEDEIVTTNLAPLGSLYAGPDGPEVQAWLLGALPAAQRDGAAETDIAANHFRLTFHDNGPGTPSATYLLVAPQAPRPSIFGRDEGRPSGWLTFLDPNGAFSLAVPGQPVTTQAPVPTGPASPVADTVHEWTSSDKATTYAVKVTDYPPGVLSGYDASAILPLLAAEYLGSSRVEELTRATSDVGGHPGLDLIAVDPSGFTCARFVIVGDRLYVLSGTGLHECPGDMAALVGSFVITRE